MKSLSPQVLYLDYNEPQDGIECNATGCKLPHSSPSPLGAKGWEAGRWPGPRFSKENARHFPWAFPFVHRQSALHRSVRRNAVATAWSDGWWTWNPYGRKVKSGILRNHARSECWLPSMSQSERSKERRGLPDTPKFPFAIKALIRLISRTRVYPLSISPPRRRRGVRWEALKPCCTRPLSNLNAKNKSRTLPSVTNTGARLFCEVLALVSYNWARSLRASGASQGESTAYGQPMHQLIFLKPPETRCPWPYEITGSNLG